LSEPTDDEWAMLDQAMHVRDNSRLGCQIRIQEDLDGLTVRLAPEQV
jgi:ferredoxin-2, mitochondrial